MHAAHGCADLHGILSVLAVLQVAVSNDGDVFIADGYCNSRVLHFSSAGKFIQSIALPKVCGSPCTPARLVLFFDPMLLPSWIFLRVT